MIGSLGGIGAIAREVFGGEPQRPASRRPQAVPPSVPSSVPPQQDN
jgi:hypothetical protein